MEEARLERSESGLVPAGEGWFVVNAADAEWLAGRHGASVAEEAPWTEEVYADDPKSPGRPPSWEALPWA